MLPFAALWTAATARVLDTSLRYTVDKTTREILFMPLPTAMKYRGEAVRRRHGRPLRQGARRALLIVADQAVAGFTWWQLS